MTSSGVPISSSQKREVNKPKKTRNSPLIRLTVIAVWIVSLKEISGRLLAARRRSGKPISANVDFYSGFVYTMLGIPIELFTPIFAIARIAGWSAHRIEELVNAGKIIRPAYKYVGTHKEYLPMEDR